MTTSRTRACHVYLFTYRKSQAVEDEYLENAAQGGTEDAADVPLDPLGEEDDEAVDTQNEDAFDGPQF